MIGGCNRCTGAVIDKRASRGTVHGAPRITAGQCITRGHPVCSRLPAHETRVRTTWLCAEIVFCPYFSQKRYEFPLVGNVVFTAVIRKIKIYSGYGGKENCKKVRVPTTNTTIVFRLSTAVRVLREYAGVCALVALLKLRRCTDCG